MKTVLTQENWERKECEAKKGNQEWKTERQNEHEQIQSMFEHIKHVVFDLWQMNEWMNVHSHAPEKIIKKRCTHTRARYAERATSSWSYLQTIRDFDDKIMTEMKILRNQMDKVICIESQIKLLVLTILTIVI